MINIYYDLRLEIKWLHLNCQTFQKLYFATLEVVSLPEIETINLLQTKTLSNTLPEPIQDTFFRCSQEMNEEQKLKFKELLIEYQVICWGWYRTNQSSRIYYRHRRPSTCTYCSLQDTIGQTTSCREGDR